jgi:ABC-2 type transport system ATP-binding protein
MSVKVQNLTKIYGTQRAVDAVSFEAKPGEVLGFLGPNGAGKSTTMKILTCYLPQSEGKVEVCGHDTSTAAMSVRQKIGYLPEHNPLYKDMYVREYLTFIAGVHRLEKPAARVAEMIERTGLGLEQNKIIGALSKGYRQRVGLAQAMIHNPEVLILDEPTTGLDPNQLTEIRNLIRELGREKTVIFSTHIMQEVHAICDRVLIINHGKIVADSPIGDLQNQVAGRSMVTVEFLEIVEKSQLERISGVKSVKSLGKNRWQLISPVAKDVRAEVFQFAVSQKFTLLEMQKEVLGVEDVFQQLTATQN